MPNKRAFSARDFSQSPFYKLRTRKRLAQILLTSLGTLEFLLKYSDLYVRRYKHKKDDEIWLRAPPNVEEAHLYRPIDIPDPKLKELQSRIADLLGRIQPPSYLFSPVKGRSYVDNAARHKGARAFWLLDIADYFPSCTSNNVARFFSHHMRCSPDVIAMLVRMTTLAGSLPQGSPCSPALAFYSNYEMWEDIARLVHLSGCELSVYADDLTISGKSVPGSLIWEIKRRVNRQGLRIKKEKELSLIDAPADITGVIVRGDRTLLPNRQHQKLQQLREERRMTRDPAMRAVLERRIAGRVAQRRQVEDGVSS